MEVIVSLRIPANALWDTVDMTVVARSVPRDFSYPIHLPLNVRALGLGPGPPMFRVNSDCGVTLRTNLIVPNPRGS